MTNLVLREINDILEVAQNEVEDDLATNPVARCAFPPDGDMSRMTLAQVRGYVGVVHELCDRLIASIDGYKGWASGVLADRVERAKDLK
jgi:hypothetical protein